MNARRKQGSQIEHCITHGNLDASEYVIVQRRNRPAATVALVLLLTATTSIANDFHVSPDGNDTSQGTKDRPFATLQRARDAVRQNAGRETQTVWLHDGIHYLPHPLKFTAADSGSSRHQIIYRGLSDGAIISGGQRLTLNWSEANAGMFKATTPSGLHIDQLFVDGKRQHMARYPNFDPEVRHFNGYAADAFSNERAARWQDPAGGFIHAMHRAHWGGYHYRITGKNADGSVAYEGGWQNNRQMGMHAQHRFVENIFEELDAPGEWFHDATSGTLYYKPAEGVDLKKATIEVVRLRQLIEFEGTQEHPVENITLHNIEFRHAARTFMDNREPLLRSDWTIHRGGAVFFNGAESCRLENCVLNQVGGNAVFVNNYNRNIEVVGCHIHDAGGNGVAFVGNPKACRSPLFNYGERQSLGDIDTTPGPQSDDYPSKCLVEDCLIYRTGRVEKQTAGVQISMSSHVTVRHCSIYEVPRAGINISEGTFGGHLIEFCDVFDTVLETGDHGSFNSWGRDRFWGLKDAPAEQLPELAKLDMVGVNIIRNSRWRCDHGWDIDLDDGSSNYRVYNNLMLSGGLKFREGFHRVAENNIMAANSFHPHVWYKNSGDIVRRNIVFSKYRPIRVPVPWGKEVDNNLLHEPGSESTAPATVLAGQSARDENSIIGDADFVDPKAGDFTVREGSPALALGFKNFPMDRFGVQRAELKKLARTPDVLVKKANSSHGGRAPVASRPMHHFWNGASIRDLKGEEFSSFGVSKESAGIHLSKVPPESAAATFGFKRNDLIQKVNGKSVKTIADLQTQQNKLAGKSMQVSIVREQKGQQLPVPRYSFFVATTSDEDSFEKLSVSRSQVIELRKVTPLSRTTNQPLKVLGDDRLAKNYGPVFGNGQFGRAYKVDLGDSVEIESVATVTFNQNGNRGSQRFVLFGSNADKDPGWNLSSEKAFTPLGEVDTTGADRKSFQATVIRSNVESLGRYRWLIWRIEPVTAQGENSAFQEFVVSKKRR